MVIDFSLPKEEDLAVIFDGIYEGAKKEIGVVDPDEREKIIQGASGLTTIEAETAFAKAIVTNVCGRKEKKEVRPISALVLQEKAEAVKKSGILEYYQTRETADSIGGLGRLKRWPALRTKVFTKKAREFGLPTPKGILLAGLPGCGKSLTAKAASNILGVPLIRFDVSRVFGGLVGQSEQNTREALKTIDAIGPSVVWIDELEKAFAGMGGSGNTDSGVSKRVFGQIITWMQEKTSAAFLMATCNDIESLPSELLRKGRWDDLFFVGLPTKKERREILDICIRKYKRDPSKMDQEALDKCAEESIDFSGAELEYGVVDALYYAFGKDKELDPGVVLSCIQATTPLAKSRKSQLEGMRKWAEMNAKHASDEVDDEGEKFGRAMEL
jgi:SpoVK/Ycf46/Vps4 family AAA+-type ATPase